VDDGQSNEIPQGPSPELSGKLPPSPTAFEATVPPDAQTPSILIATVNYGAMVGTCRSDGHLPGPQRSSVILCGFPRWPILRNAAANVTANFGRCLGCTASRFYFIWPGSLR
jgi:hypothetical protein